MSTFGLRIRPRGLVANGQCQNDWALLVREGRIEALGPDAEVPRPEGIEHLDAPSSTLIPGLIDLQFNGAFGHHLTDDPGRAWDCAAGLPRYGVTTFLPTLITCAPETTNRALEVFGQGPPADHRGARVPGFHFEGPYLHPDRVGAHDPRFLRSPRTDEIEHWSRDAGVALVTLAPERDGAHAMITQLREAGVVVSAGHTTATYEEACAAFDTGVRHVTHLFNAMPAIHHRAPGLPTAALSDPRVVVGIIPDGIHVHPELVAMVRRLVGAQRLAPVTDAMSAMGMPPGHYAMGDFRITVDETSARQDDGTLAGSILTLDQALRNLIRFTDLPLEDVLPGFTEVPADLLELDAGRLRVGAPADLVLLNSAGEVERTWVNGELLHESAPENAP